jgi:hypothetical protein
MEIKILTNDDGVVVSTTVRVDNLDSEENLKKVFVSFIKFLHKSGAKFPDELGKIMKDFEQ